MGALQQRAHCCHLSHAVPNFKLWEVLWTLSQEHGSCRGVTCTAGRSVPPRFTPADVWGETFATIFTVPVANHYHPRSWAKTSEKAGEETGGGRTRKRLQSILDLFFSSFPKINTASNIQFH